MKPGRKDQMSLDDPNNLLASHFEHYRGKVPNYREAPMRVDGLFTEYENHTSSGSLTRELMTMLWGTLIVSRGVDGYEARDKVPALYFDLMDYCIENNLPFNWVDGKFTDEFQRLWEEEYSKMSAEEARTRLAMRELSDG